MLDKTSMYLYGVYVVSQHNIVFICKREETLSITFYIFLQKT